MWVAILHGVLISFWRIELLEGVYLSKINIKWNTFEFSMFFTQMKWTMKKNHNKAPSLNIIVFQKFSNQSNHLIFHWLWNGWWWRQENRIISFFNCKSSFICLFIYLFVCCLFVCLFICSFVYLFVVVCLFVVC